MSILIALGGLGSVSPDELQNRIDCAPAALGVSFNPTAPNMDAENAGFWKRMDAARIRQSGRAIDAMIARDSNLGNAVERYWGQSQEWLKYKKDNANPTMGTFLARELEYVYAEVLRDPPLPTSALTMLPIDTRVPPGAKYHTVTRTRTVGAAEVYSGTGEVKARVGLGSQEERFPVAHCAIGVDVGFFSLLSSGFANRAELQEKIAGARDAINAKINHMTWFGDKKAGMYGVLNYPHLARRHLSEHYGITGVDKDLILRQLNQAKNWPGEHSYNRLAPNKYMFGSKAYNYLNQTPRSSGSDKTLMQVFMESNRIAPGDILEVPEFTGAGPGGTDAILMTRGTREGLANVIVNPFGMLAPQDNGFNQTTFCYGSHGGPVMREAGASILCYATID